MMVLLANRQQAVKCKICVAVNISVPQTYRNRLDCAKLHDHAAANRPFALQKSTDLFTATNLPWRDSVFWEITLLSQADGKDGCLA
jgi:hypothetical protein